MGKILLSDRCTILIEVQLYRDNKVTIIQDTTHTS